jgi:DNA repair photolyase
MFYTAAVELALEPRRADVEYVEQPCKSALNPVKGMGFRWSLNPYMGCEHRCTFCYVRAFEQRADRPSGEAYGRSIRVKVNVVAVLRSELARPRWKRESVAVGAATDPYQPAEGRYRLTRGCLEAFRDYSNPVALITRGPMIVRDIDVLMELASRAELSVNFSIPTLDPDIWRRTEPGTAPPRQRLRAIEKLVAAGIKAGVAMAPLLPGLSDRPELIDELVAAARAVGATHLWGGVLYLRSGTREHFMASLAKHWPELVPRYEEEYARVAYLPRAATLGTQKLVAAARERHSIRDRRTLRLEPEPEPRQLSLLAG